MTRGTASSTARTSGTVARNYDDWMTLGDRYRKRARPEKALEAYEHAVELEPTQAEAHVSKGWCFLELGHLELALGAFSRAVKVNDRYVEAFHGLAEVHRTLDNQEKAVKYYELFLKKSPEDDEARPAIERQLDALRGQ